MVKRLLLSVLLVSAACIASSCVSTNTTDCASSPPLADGDSTPVRVEVVTKPGLGVNVIGSIDVNEGLYSTPQEPIHGDPTATTSATDLAIGKYEGRVSREGIRLTLAVEGLEYPLDGPESCD
jgi:hypothetical protein